MCKTSELNNFTKNNIHMAVKENKEKQTIFLSTDKALFSSQNALLMSNSNYKSVSDDYDVLPLNEFSYDAAEYSPDYLVP